MSEIYCYYQIGSVFLDFSKLPSRWKNSVHASALSPGESLTMNVDPHAI